MAGSTQWVIEALKAKMLNVKQKRQKLIGLFSVYGGMLGHPNLEQFEDQSYYRIAS